MTKSTISISMVINAPVERVWSLLIEYRQPNRQKIIEQKYFQREPEELPVAGQIIHMKAGFLHSTMYINHVVQEAHPYDGQTISATVNFLGKDGEIVSRWFRDSEHYHIQTQLEAKHPRYEVTEHTNIRCLAIDTTSCVVVWAEQSEMTFRLAPRWLTRLLDNDRDVEKATAKSREVFLQSVKAKAEQNFKQPTMESSR